MRSSAIVCSAFWTLGAQADCVAQRLLGGGALFVLHPALPGAIVQPRGQAGVLGVQQLNARPARCQLCAQALRLFRALGAFTPGAVDVVFIVLDIGFQHRGAARLLGSALLGLAQLLAQLVGFAVDAGAYPRKAARTGA